MKDLTNAKEKLEGQIQEREETIAILKKKINGLVSFRVDIFDSEKIKRTFERFSFPFYHLQENGFARQSEEWENQSEASLAAMREEAEILHSTLREITHAVRQDADNTSKLVGSPGGDIEVVDAGLLEGAEDDFLSKRPISPSRAARLRSTSPTRSRSPAVSDNALAQVHSAIQKKNIQVMVRAFFPVNSC